MMANGRPHGGMPRPWLVIGMLGCLTLLEGPGALAEARRPGPTVSAVVAPDATAAELRFDVGARARAGGCGGESGDCWTVGSVVTLSANIAVAGRSAACSKRCRLPVTQDLALDAGRYTWSPALATLCPRGGDFVLADTGTTIPGPRRRLRLVPDALPDLESCVGNGARFSSWVRQSREGTKLSGSTVIRGRAAQPTSAGTARIGFAVRFDHVGVPAGSGAPALPGAKDCGTSIILRCTL